MLKSHSEVNILIIDDMQLAIDDAIETIEAFNFTNDIHIDSAKNIEEATQLLESNLYHIILLDKALGVDPETDLAINGLDYLPSFKELQNHIEVIVITSSSETDDTVYAIKQGAFDFVEKVKMSEVLELKFINAYRLSLLALQNKAGEKLRPTIPGHSRAIRKLITTIQKLSKINCEILILGETGTGKTWVAEHLHNLRCVNNNNSNSPFQNFCISSHNDNLIDRSLFGSVKGGFNGSLVTKGAIERSHNGTLFIDEIGESSPSVQKKLLQSLQNGKFSRIGEDHLRTSKFNLITATNRDLEQMIKKSEFREDLYMRISTFTIKIPPLRERKEDIPEVIKAILPEVNTTVKTKLDFSD